MQPPASSHPPHPGSFGPGAAVQVMTPPGPPAVLEGRSSHAGNYFFSGNMPPKQTDQSYRTNVRADGTQEMAVMNQAPAFIQSVSQPACPNPSPNMTMWMPEAPTFQAPAGVPKTSVTPGPPGIASSQSFPSTSTMQAAPPGLWCQPQQVTGFARPPFSPYPAVVTGPYPMLSRGMPPASFSFPDIQPPGVSLAGSSLGAPTASFAGGGQLFIGSGQSEIPPEIDNREHVNSEAKDIAKEQLDAWTAHRAETGTVYYYNASTRESTYEKPSGFREESNKTALQPTPISWEKLSGTDWTLVTTNDGKTYYYNTITQVKDSFKGDPRYKSVKHDDREKLFNEYLSELKAAEEETARVAKAKQDEEDKLKERERVLRKRKEREEQEVERVRQKARRKESIESYQALLVETIKHPQASWTESKPKLEKDPQGRAANPHLDKSDLEKLFREHVKTLYERCVLEFRALLTDVITGEAGAQETEDGKTTITSWSTAKQVLKSDPRYNKMPRKERETLWRRHAEEILRKQKKANDQGEKSAAEGKSNVDSGKHLSEGSRRTHDQRR